MDQKEDQGRQVLLAALELHLQASLDGMQTKLDERKRKSPEPDCPQRPADHLPPSTASLSRPSSPGIGSAVTSASCSPQLVDPVWMERMKRSRNILAYEIIQAPQKPASVASQQSVELAAPQSRGVAAAVVPPASQAADPAPKTDAHKEGSLSTLTRAAEESAANGSDARKIGTLPVARLKQFRRYDCTRCGKLFHTSRDLRQHVDVVHDKHKPFACDLCPRTFGLKGNLVKHCVNKHSTAGTRELIPCPFCDRRFSMKGNLKKHVETVHHRIRPFSCNHCAAQFSRRGNLNQHCLLVHSSTTEAEPTNSAASIDPAKVSCPS